jgi:hypothetical protein
MPETCDSALSGIQSQARAGVLLAALGPGYFVDAKVWDDSWAQLRRINESLVHAS